MASLNRIGESLENFKKTGKEVVTYLDMATDKDYYLATYSSKIYLEPSASAGIGLTGLGAQMNFYGNLLNKIGVKVNVVHAGKYKGAGETYSRTALSEPHRKNLTNLIDKLYNEKIGITASNRNTDSENIKNVYENRDEMIISKEDALKYLLVDGLKTEEEIKAEYQIFKDKAVKYTSYDLNLSSKFDEKIAVIYAQGNIMPGSKYNQNALSNAKIKAQVDKIVKDGTIRAVVLRVDSPGGSALESEKIYNTLRRLNVPIYVSMANVAASGGYYISCAGKHVFADPMTITGSIGVVSMIPNASKLADNIGITTDGVKRGKFAGALNLWDPTSKDMIDSFQKNAEDIYFEFKTRVSEGRALDLNAVEKVAQGQVWTGDQALGHKLVNSIGTLQNTIEFAAKETGLTNYEVVYYPHQRTMLESILEENLNLENVAVKFKGLPLGDLEKMKNFWNLIKDERNLTLMPYKVN
jgi:protease-4